MDAETVLETCLMQFSPIRGRDLRKKLEEKGLKLSRAQFYRYGRKLKKSGKLEQINGVWHYRQPENAASFPGLPGESEQDKAQAITIMKSCQALTGYQFSKDEWLSVLNSSNGKSMLDKAKALTTLIYSKALIG